MVKRMVRTSNDFSSSWRPLETETFIFATDFYRWPFLRNSVQLQSSIYFHESCTRVAQWKLRSQDGVGVDPSTCPLFKWFSFDNVGKKCFIPRRPDRGDDLSRARRPAAWRMRRRWRGDRPLSHATPFTGHKLELRIPTLNNLRSIYVNISPRT